jgi:hypothetical protein
MLLVLLLLASLDASPAFAHGLGRSYDLPLPVWLYLYGAAAAVLISFVPISLLTDKRHALRGYPRFDLLRIKPLQVLLSARPVLMGLRIFSVALFVLVILTGFFGKQSSSANFAPTFVWITWWVGLSFFTAFIGNIWPLINPWKITFEWADRLARRLGVKGGIQLGVFYYPTRWGVWPALVFYAAAIGIEVDFTGSAVPMYVAYFVVVYSFITWWGMLIFGKDTWLRHGEAFSVFYSLLGRFAPTEVRVKTAQPCKGCSGTCGRIDGGCVNCYECFANAPPEERELNLRPPAIGLTRPDPVSPSGLVFVIFVLASVTYDGLVVTPPWARVEYLLGVPRTLGLLVVPLLFLSAYLSFVKLSQLFGGGGPRFREVALAYVYSLVPIAVAYEVAHYYTFFLVQGQRIATLISDPFGWNWNLFGTAGYGLNMVIIQADLVWYSQVALIVGGHVVAVYLAHLVALRLLKDRRKALLSQLPMLMLMVLYTVSSLWILSQPVIEEEKMSTAPPEPVIQPSEELVLSQTR